MKDTLLGREVGWLWGCGTENVDCLKFFKEQVYNAFGFLKDTIKMLMVIKCYDAGSFSSRILNKSLPLQILKQLYSSMSSSFLTPPTGI